VIPSGGVAPAGSVAKVVAGLRIHATAGIETRENATNVARSDWRKRFIGDLHIIIRRMKAVV
jgi:hypothetical protein